MSVALHRTGTNRTRSSGSEGYASSTAKPPWSKKCQASFGEELCLKNGKAKRKKSPFRHGNPYTRFLVRVLLQKEDKPWHLSLVMMAGLADSRVVENLFHLLEKLGTESRMSSMRLKRTVSCFRRFRGTVV